MSVEMTCSLDAIPTAASHGGGGGGGGGTSELKNMVTPGGRVAASVGFMRFVYNNDHEM